MSNLPEIIRKQIFRLVQNTMHATSPQHFYKPYKEAERHKHVAAGPFETEVLSKISYLLESEFNAEVIHLVLKQTETELTKKLFEVTRTPHDFLSHGELGSGPGAPKISLQGSFTVEGVSEDGWETFQERDVSADLLKKRVGDCMTACFKRLPEAAVMEMSETSLLETMNSALQAARSLIAKEFGLSLELMITSWDCADELITLRANIEKTDLKEISKRIARLKDELLELYEINASQEDIDAVRATIDRLVSLVPPRLKPSLGYLELPAPSAVKELKGEQVDAPMLR